MSAKKKAGTMYMHLIDGRPASYEAGYQISFAPTGRYARKGIRLVPTLVQIRAEQRATAKWRNAQGFTVDGFSYSYALVRVPK